MTAQHYEIDRLLPALQAHLATHASAVIAAPPGSGKSTVLPLRLLESPWLGSRKVLLLQPRRIAARNVAFRLAEVHGSKVGDTIGYRVRFESSTSDAARLEVVTEGILIRMLQDDPALEQVGAVIFDEFHERTLQADLALALVLDAQTNLRPDLRVLLMSATLDVTAARELIGAPLFECSGRQYPVEIEYLSEDPKGWIDTVAARKIAEQFAQHEGDTLVFMPGVREIRRTADELDRLLAPHRGAYELLPLYGDLPFAEQQRAIRPSAEGKRKIIIATPIAETSLTIEGVTLVIDSGLRNSVTFDPAYGLSRFQPQTITKDSADQRAGRAGRLGPGRCIRLWSLNSHRAMREHREPEILTADLSALRLELAAWGVADPTALRWIDPPPPPLLQHATATLRFLGALDSELRITERGRALHRFGAHPRIAQLLLKASELGATSLGADLAALLEERDPLSQESVRSASIEDRLEALTAYRRGQASGPSKSQLARIDRAAAEWRKRLPSPQANDLSAGALLSFAFPERIAKQRSPNSARYLTAAGSGVQLREGDGLARNPFIVALDARVGAGDALINLAAPISESELQQLHHDSMVTADVVRWDERQGAVVAERQTSLHKLPVSSERLTRVDPAARARLLMTGLRARGGAATLGWPDAAQELRQRVMAARRAYPEAALPDLTDAALNDTLEEWLAPFLGSTSRLEQLQSVDLFSALQSLLTFEQRKFVNRVAPVDFQLPAGKRPRLDYSNVEEAVLAATVQELLGLHRTPSLGDGKIPLSVHLLSPARRPVQVTRDLESFWKTTYQQVKKELKGRYPKHYWPEDPISAPMHRPKKG